MYTYKITVCEYDDYEVYGNYVAYLVNESFYDKEQFKAICENVKDKSRLSNHTFVCKELEDLGFRMLKCDTEINIERDLCNED
jgi:hypothetical protein